MIHKRFCQIQRLLARCQRPLRNVEFEIELSKLEISAGHVRHQSGDAFPGAPHLFASSCARAVSDARRYLPQKSRFQAEDRGHEAVRQSIGWNRTRRRIMQIRAAAGDTHVRKLIRARDAHLRLRFQNAGCSDTHIVMLLERGANQLLQLRVLENIPPFLLAE